MYTIKAITNLTGLTAETLRAWERRYDCVTPERNQSGRRSYSQQDLEKLKLLAHLTRNGHAISKIACMSCEQLRQYQTTAVENSGSERQTLLNQLIDALRQYRIERCEQLLKRALLASEPLDYARDILLPALNQVGQLWHEEKINVAQEHMFSSCVKRIVLTMVNTMHHPSEQNPSILFATPAGEPHEFGILVACLLAASQQYTCYYLGVDLPAPDIVDACKHLQPDILVMGLVKTPPEPQSAYDVRRIADAVDNAERKIWLGGAGARYWFEHQPTPAPNCHLIDDIDDFHIKAEHFRMMGR